MMARHPRRGGKWVRRVFTATKHRETLSHQKRRYHTRLRLDWLSSNHPAALSVRCIQVFINSFLSRRTMKKPRSPLNFWWQHEDSSDDDDDDEHKTPRAIKAKESPLPSIASTWDASPLDFRGLHHRANAAAAATATTERRRTSAFAALTCQDDDLRVLPRTVHSPYREPRRKPPRSAFHPKGIRPRNFLFHSLIALLLVYWSITGILYVLLQQPVRLTTSSWWSHHNHRPWPNMAIDTSPLRNLHRLHGPISSTTRRRRDSRQRRPNGNLLLHAVSPIQWSLDDKEHNTLPSSSSSSPASMEALCGYAAEMASLQYPDYFPDSLALNANARILWVGARWDLLQRTLESCPATQLSQVVRTLPDDPLERIRILREHPSIIFDVRASNPVRFVEILPLGLQTRQTKQSVSISNATHVVWVLDNGDNDNEQDVKFLTRLVETRQMIQDLRDAHHIVIVGEHTFWREALVKAANLPSVTWVSETSALIPAMQMRRKYLKLDESARRMLLPATTPTMNEPFIPAPRWPCASECANAEHCLASIWDDTVRVTQALTQECTIVVYTANGDPQMKDLVATEFHPDDDSDELICNVAFVAKTSTLVQSAIQRVPNPDLVRLGVEPQPGDDAHAIHQRKLKTLNGKLLFRGWVLVWVDTPWTGTALPVLNPSVFWSTDVRFALYCEPTLAPSQTDTKFLVDQMYRSAWPAHNARQGHKHYRLPAEPSRQAVLLLAERRFEKKPATLKKALKMWGDDVTNATMLHHQAALYDQFDVLVNRQRYQRLYFKPQDSLPYRYQLRHWASTRWILHDLKSAEASTLRCSWYEEVEHTQGSPVLALAHLLALQNLKRRMAFGEPDDHTIQHTWGRRMAFKESLTDVQEWIPLAIEANRPVAAVAYQLDTTSTTMSHAPQSFNPDLGTPLYVRLMSDRVTVAARKAYHG